jgi:hypothetical protein
MMTGRRRSYLERRARLLAFPGVISRALDDRLDAAHGWW